MTGDHLLELLYRGSTSGFVKQCYLFLWLQLLSQFIVENVTKLALNNTILLTPAACIHLRYQGKQQRNVTSRWRQWNRCRFRVYGESVNVMEAYLIVWLGGETPSKVQWAFFTQAATGRAINNTFTVFVTLLERDEPLQWVLNWVFTSWVKVKACPHRR